MRRVAISAACALLCAAAAHAQAGRSGDWMTSGNDAQRSSWVRTDAKIAPASMSKPGFEFLWKMKLEHAQRPTEPVLMDRIIGYRGFRTLGFVGGASDKVYVMDTDLARPEWEVQLPSGPKKAPSANCPGGITSALARPTTAAFPSAAGGLGFGGGRGGPAKSEVGEPGEGAPILARAPTPRPPRADFAKPGGPGARPARPGSPVIADGPFGRGITPLYAVSSDGMLRILNVQNGALVGRPYPFVPANSNASGLIVVNGVAYATTDGNCGGENGVYAVDTHSGDSAKWTASGGIAGPAAMAPDGSLYVATRGGELVALEAQTLKPLGAYKAGTGFTASPVMFQLKQRTLVAAPAADGSVHLVDIAALSSAAGKSAPLGGPVSGLATWEDPSGTRWLLAAGKDSVAALKVAESGGGLSIEPGWTARAAAPLRPLIVNGVVFVASGAPKAASLVALDGLNGKELWNSGKSIPPGAQAAGLSGGGGQVYVGTHDGTLYAFGFPMEH